MYYCNTISIFETDIVVMAFNMYLDVVLPSQFWNLNFGYWVWWWKIVPSLSIIDLLINQMLIFQNNQTAILASLANLQLIDFRNCFQVEDGSDEFSLGNNNFKVKYNFHFTLTGPKSLGIIAIKQRTPWFE